MSRARRVLGSLHGLGGARVRPILWFPPLTLLGLALPGLIRVGEVVTLSAVLTLLLMALLLLRRRHPTLVFALACVVGLAQRGTGERLVGVVAMLIALYTLTSLRSARYAAAAGLALEAGLALALVWWPSPEDWWVSFLLLSAMAAASGVLGVYARTRAAYLAELRERAERLERERDQQFALAAADERAHIARELHDIVAHHLTVMIALADGATAAVSTSPARASEVMTSVSATGRKALADTRRLLGVLRADEKDVQLRPQPNLGRLEALMEQVRSAGLPVTLTTTGQPRELSPALQLTVYRVIQEALTNTLKHAGPGTQACLRLTYTDEDLSVDIRDDGLGSAMLAPNGSESTKHGLNGMRERVTAWSGDLHAGPASPRGWVVSARLPTEAETPAASPR